MWSIGFEYGEEMPIRKSYAEHGDACATAHGIELIGDVWTYPVVREMFLGPKRFSELAALLHGITPAVLTARLRELETKGVVVPTTFAPPALGKGYALTPWGHELERPLEAVAQWAHGSPSWNPEGGLTPDAAVLAMKAMSRGVEHRATSPLAVQLLLSDGRCAAPVTYAYALTWDEQGLAASRGDLPDAAATVRADSTAWAQALFGGDVLPDGAVTGSGTMVDVLLRRYSAARA